MQNPQTNGEGAQHSARIITLATTDPAEFELALRPLDLMCKPTMAGRFAHRMKMLATRRFMLYRESYSLGLRLNGLSPPGMMGISFGIKDTGGSVYWGAIPDKRSIPAMLPGALDVGFGASHEHLILFVLVSELQQAMQPHAYEWLTGQVARNRLDLAPGKSARLKTLLGNALTVANARQDLLAGPDFENCVFDGLVETLNALADENDVESGLFTKARQRGFDRALEFIRDAGMGQLSVSELSRVAEISERSLQYAFRDRLGMTPKEFLHLRRLHMARRKLLITEPGNTTVTEVAIQHDFFELGRFAGAYRRRFGELPSQTLARNTPYLPGVAI